MSKTIIGIDLGISRLGLGVIEIDQQLTPRVLEHNTFETSSSLPLGERLVLIKNYLTEVLFKYPDNEVVIEQIYNSAESHQWILDIAYVKGVIICLLSDANIVVHEIHPTEVKYALTGDYFAKKSYVTASVKRILSIESVRYDDESDALACALCLVSKMRSEMVV
jgi:crossover junction endodeoxyribonuclease RuvC